MEVLPVVVPLLSAIHYFLFHKKTLIKESQLDQIIKILNTLNLHHNI